MAVPVFNLDLPGNNIISVMPVYITEAGYVVLGVIFSEPMSQSSHYGMVVISPESGGDWALNLFMTNKPTTKLIMVITFPAAAISITITL